MKYCRLFFCDFQKVTLNCNLKPFLFLNSIFIQRWTNTSICYLINNYLALDRENTAKMAHIRTLKNLTSHGNFCHFSVAVLIFELKLFAGKLYPGCKKFEDYHMPRLTSFFGIHSRAWQLIMHNNLSLMISSLISMKFISNNNLRSYYVLLCFMLYGHRMLAPWFVLPVWSWLTTGSWRVKSRKCFLCELR